MCKGFLLACSTLVKHKLSILPWNFETYTTWSLDRFPASLKYLKQVGCWNLHNMIIEVYRWILLGSHYYESVDFSFGANKDLINSMSMDIFCWSLPFDVVSHDPLFVPILLFIFPSLLFPVIFICFLQVVTDFNSGSRDLLFALSRVMTKQILLCPGR